MYHLSVMHVNRSLLIAADTLPPLLALESIFHYCP